MSDDETPTEAYNTNDGDAPTRRMPQQPADTPTERIGATPSQPGDAPTERMGATPPRDSAAAPGSDAATEYIPVAGVAASATPPPPLGPDPVANPESTPPGRSRALLITLIAIGAALVIALIVLIIMLTSNDDTPVPVDSPTASVSATPTPAPSTTPSSPTPSPTESSTPSPTPAPSATSTPTATAPPAASAATFTAFSPEDGAPVLCNDAESQQPVDFAWTSTGAAQAWFGIGTDDAKANPDADVDPSGTYSTLYDCSLETETFTVTLDNGDGVLTHRTVTLNRALGD
ncbi:hypothetical protein B0I08_101241 [Glaciihabitans tibetensis]|uniref:Uncharacterized protein n=1 Tax=Glaciihabitans tibetensis TaxID=1266600 RepID=A0A2T0VIQ8_9MICO|nr:hypothetical protein [Glaciihabitans tibetensis]PRY70114.1 hypothetical protein B0I08_101241 [Glaciihabitans tibetensis]